MYMPQHNLPKLYSLQCRLSLKEQFPLIFNHEENTDCLLSNYYHLIISENCLTTANKIKIKREYSQNIATDYFDAHQLIVYCDVLKKVQNER